MTKMRFYLAILLLFPSSIYAQETQTLVKFERETIDLGIIIKGQLVKNEFVFKNISDIAVEIDLVSTCDCTEASWTYGAILPGEKGWIKFIFDSSKIEKVEAMDVDVHFLNTDPNTGNPLSVYLRYTFEYK